MKEKNECTEKIMNLGKKPDKMAPGLFHWLVLPVTRHVDLYDQGHDWAFLQKELQLLKKKIIRKPPLYETARHC